jgi:alkyl hydroperoxide reductase subunit AhpF
MSLLSAADQDRLRQLFGAMTRRVRLVFVTQTLECETCQATRQILDELVLLSDKTSVDEINLILERDKATRHGIDRAPGIAILYDGSPDPNVESWTDSRARFLGAPSGYEFVSLVQAVLLAGGRPPQLSPGNLSRIGTLDRQLTMKVFTTPT